MTPVTYSPEVEAQIAEQLEAFRAMYPDGFNPCGDQCRAYWLADGSTKEPHANCPRRPA